MTTPQFPAAWQERAPLPWSRERLGALTPASRSAIRGRRLAAGRTARSTWSGPQPDDLHLKSENSSCTAQNSQQDTSFERTRGTGGTLSLASGSREPPSWGHNDREQCPHQFEDCALAQSGRTKPSRQRRNWYKSELPEKKDSVNRQDATERAVTTGSRWRTGPVRLDTGSGPSKKEKREEPISGKKRSNFAG